MYPMQVGLVPYAEGLVATDELLHVASALQTQVTRDLGPLWDVSAVVSPFLGLEDIPLGYAPLVIVEGLGPQSHGFHIVRDGQPVALIAHESDWSILASHELLELLCDPWGYRRIPARSFVNGQGQVEYLVEVCDPCQHDEYTINDVAVSDFVTPDYYGPLGTQGGRYCFTGAMDHPLEARIGGTLTWRTAAGQTWQRSGRARPRLLPVTDSSRASTESHRVKKRTARGPASQPKQPVGAASSAQQHGKELRASIAQLLSQLGVKSEPSQAAKIRALLEEFATENSAVRSEYEKNPGDTLKKLGIDPPTDRKLLKKPLAPHAHFRGVLATLEGGSGLGDPKLADWLSTHSSFHI